VVAEPVEFEARVFGRLGPDATAAFTDLSVHVKAGMTLMSARWTSRGCMAFLSGSRHGVGARRRPPGLIDSVAAAVSNDAVTSRDVAGCRGVVWTPERAASRLLNTRRVRGAQA
jgi:hypothetical protein